MADHLFPQKARILAMLVLQKTSDTTEPQKFFDWQVANIVGMDKCYILDTCALAWGITMFY